MARVDVIVCDLCPPGEEEEAVYRGLVNIAPRDGAEGHFAKKLDLCPTHAEGIRQACVPMRTLADPPPPPPPPRPAEPTYRELTAGAE